MTSLDIVKAGEIALTNTCTFSDRETEILELISLGFSSTEIAKKLYLSIHTVHSHRKKIMYKMGVHNTALLIRSAFENQLISF